MKLIKRLIGLAVVIVIVLALGIGAIFMYVDTIAKSAIEKSGTYALGVPTTLESADVGLLSGSFGMTGLNVANPEGFKGNFFTLGSGDVNANLGSVTKPVIEIPKLELSTIRVSLERTVSGSNYQRILDNLKKFEGKDEGTKSKEGGDGKKLIVRELVVRDVVVKVEVVGLPGAGAGVTVPIHEITLTNIGSAEGGLNSGDLINVVVKAILVAAAERGGGIIPGDVLGELNGSLAQLGDLDKLGVEVVGKAGESAQKLADSLSKIGSDAIKKTGEDAKKALEGLIPGKK